MKTKEKDQKKNLSAGELKTALTQLREKQFRLRFKHRVTPLANPLELRAVRRDIARLETYLRQKQLAGKE
ncbi:MAG: 50S ribosomal protein L29 [Elusimicrobia bacterium]|nr:50S ribosomal protein L29 [Elusimicrobiota bacterium]MBI5594968.1 50S ribosomal protein L29 [Elusimicrobiota bacterium]